MNEKVETITPAEIAQTEAPNRRATALGLGVLASGAVLAQATGVVNELSPDAQAVATSCAHPLLGYVGAWAATSAVGDVSRRAGTTIGLAGATVANFATEIAQSVTVASPEYAEFWSSQHLPETAKDYLFALGGFALFMLQKRTQ